MCDLFVLTMKMTLDCLFRSTSISVRHLQQIIQAQASFDGAQETAFRLDFLKCLLPSAWNWLKIYALAFM